MSKYNRKQNKPSQDEFISFWAKMFNKIAPYARAIGITGATAVVIWFAVWGISSWRESKAAAAAELFGRAVKIYDADLLGDAPAPKSDEENPIPRFKTAKERTDAAVLELDKLDREYGGSSVAHNAKLFRAGILYDLGKFEEAAAIYQKFLADSPGGSLAAVAREGAALCDEQRGKLDDALAKFKQLEPSGPKNEFYKDRALYGQARIHLKKGEKTKAAELLKEILTKTPTSPLRDEVQNQLASLEAT